MGTPEDVQQLLELLQPDYRLLLLGIRTYRHLGQPGADTRDLRILERCPGLVQVCRQTTPVGCHLKKVPQGVRIGQWKA